MASWCHDLHEVEKHQRVLCSKIQVREGQQFLYNRTGKSLALAFVATRPYQSQGKDEMIF